jgi:magnesium chelatase family protein
MLDAAPEGPLRGVQVTVKDMFSLPWRGEADPECSCSPLSISRYQARLRGALADQTEVFVTVGSPSAAEIGGPPVEASKVVRERVLAARERQERRLGSGCCNANADAAEVSRFVLSEAVRQLLY